MFGAALSAFGRAAALRGPVLSAWRPAAAGANAAAPASLLLLPRVLQPFQPLPSRTTAVRTAVANFRPKRLRHAKVPCGFWPSRSGGTLRGSQPCYGEYGLKAKEGRRLTDKQIDVARTAARRVLKPHRGSKFFLRIFPHRPVTKKAAETRMGKGKGNVDHFAQWVAPGHMLFEVRGVRKEIAEQALTVAGANLGIKVQIVAKAPDAPFNTHAPRCLPHFIRQRLHQLEYDAVGAVPSPASMAAMTATTTTTTTTSAPPPAVTA